MNRFKQTFFFSLGAIVLSLALAACSQNSVPKADPDETHTNSTSTLKGTVWHDKDEDTFQNNNEPGLANWTIYLDSNENGQLDDGEPQTRTASDGSYSFSGLSAGDYTISQLLKAGWMNTYPGFEGFEANPFEVNTKVKLTQPSIIGGNPADQNEYPWMVALVSRTANASEGQFCGGALISERFVLTAAHCIEDSNANQVDALIGATQLNQASQGERIQVSKIHAYPNYDGNEMLGDVAVLELARASTQPTLRLIDADKLALQEAGKNATVIGWGNRATNGEDFPDTLHEVDVPLRSDAECTAAYSVTGKQYDDAWLCAAPEEGGKDSCQGDSGGPLLVNENNTWYHVGIVSFGDVCGSSTMPGVYAQTSTYLPWIKSLTSGSPTNPQPAPQPAPNPEPTPAPEPTVPLPENFSLSYYVELSDGETIDQLDFGNTKE